MLQLTKQKKWIVLLHLRRCSLLAAMEDALAKIRPHTSSSLPHQKTPANLLIALESTFKDQGTELTPTAYFAALITTLDGTIQKKDIALDDGSILPAEIYLLALVAPFVAAPVIRSNLNTLLALTAPLFPVLNKHAPALRSQLSLYHAIFLALDRTQLEVQGVRQTFASILQLCIDPRPKVRRKAVEVVKDILAQPPLPLINHPYAERVAEWVLSSITEINAGPFAKGKGAKHAPAPGAEIAIHVLAFLRPVVPYLPSQVIVIYFISVQILTFVSRPCLRSAVFFSLSPASETHTSRNHHTPSCPKYSLRQ